MCCALYRVSLMETMSTETLYLASETFSSRFLLETWVQVVNLGNCKKIAIDTEPFY